jgi:opacity protein-like surface antigen
MTVSSQLKLSVLLALAAVQSAVAQEFFVRPTLSYVSSSIDGYDSCVTPGVSAGLYFGGKSQHEVSVNTLFPKFTFDYTYQGVREYGNEKFLPLLLDYKYHAVGIDPYAKNVDFYFGGSAGFARSELDILATNGFTTISGTDRDWVFSYGGSAGFIIKLAKHFDVDLGYRFLGLTKEKFTIANIPLTGEDSHAHVIYAGIGYRF